MSTRRGILKCQGGNGNLKVHTYGSRGRLLGPVRVPWLRSHPILKCQTWLLFSGRTWTGSAATDRNNYACPPIPKSIPSLIFNCNSSRHKQNISRAAHCLIQSRYLPTGMLGAAAQGGASLSTRPRKKGASVLNVCTFSLADLFVFVTFCTIPTWPIVSSLRRNSIFGAIETSPHTHPKPV